MRINTNIFITIYKNLDNIIKNLKIKQESPDFLKKYVIVILFTQWNAIIVK